MVILTFIGILLIYKNGQVICRFENRTRKINNEKQKQIHIQADKLFQFGKCPTTVVLKLIEIERKKYVQLFIEFHKCRVKNPRFVEHSGRMFLASSIQETDFNVKYIVKTKSKIKA